MCLCGIFNLCASLQSGQLDTQTFYCGLPNRSFCKALSATSSQHPGWRCFQNQMAEGGVPCLPPTAAHLPSSMGACLAHFPYKMSGWGRGRFSVPSWERGDAFSYRLVISVLSPAFQSSQHLQFLIFPARVAKICPLLADCPFGRHWVPSFSVLLILPSAFHLPKICCLCVSLLLFSLSWSIHLLFIPLLSFQWGLEGADVWWAYHI